MILLLNFNIFQDTDACLGFNQEVNSGLLLGVSSTQQIIYITTLCNRRYKTRETKILTGQRQ